MKYSNIERVYKIDKAASAILKYLPFFVLVMTVITPVVTFSIMPSLIGDQPFDMDSITTFLPGMLMLVIIPILWALSPLWSAYYMWRLGGRPMTQREWDYIGGQEIEEIIERTFPERQGKKLRFYVVDTEDLNAFALAGNKVAIYRGLLKFDKRTIQAVIMHELGHQLLGHTKLLIALEYSRCVTYPKYFLRRLRLGFKAYGKAKYRVTGDLHESLGFGAVGYVFEGMFLILFGSFQFIIFEPFLQKLFRLHEYEADMVACELGYASELLSFLELIQTTEFVPAHSIVERLTRTHPYVAYRIDKVYNYIHEQEVA